MSDQSVDQRAPIMSRRRMGDQTRRLVNHDKLVVFEHHGEGNRLCCHVDGFGRWHLYAYDFATAQFLATVITGDVINDDFACLDQAP